jgi:predicted NAD/FAD-dependent oxidoreductase
MTKLSLEKVNSFFNGDASMKVALIGAGAAGAACVSVLRSRGADFCVYEKSRGPGGRLSTRRVSGVVPEGDIYYDHGAPYFSWSQKLTAQLAESLQSSTLHPFKKDTWIASPSMPQLVKDLLGRGEVHLQTEIDAIEGRAGEWFLREKIKPHDISPVKHGPFTAVVITAPAPQAQSLLREINCSWKSQLSLIEYNPCWALMATFNEIQIPRSFSSTILSSELNCQQDKPGRIVHKSNQSWVAQATPEWSRAHLEEPAELVLEQLLKELLSLFELKKECVVHSAVHRWRYSTVAKALGQVALSDPQQGLFYAADGCLGTGVAGAVESGLKTGEGLSLSLKTRNSDL